MDREMISCENQVIIAKNILKKFKGFCTDNNLRYYLAFGTLLGAVRHKDIIPWDYDIDVFMPRPDFEKFLCMTENKDFAENIHTFSWKNTPDYYISFAKVCDMTTRLVITKTKSKIPLGVWIDIFPLDAIPDNKDDADKLRKFYNHGEEMAYIPIEKKIGITNKLKAISSISESKKHGQANYLREIAEAAQKNDYETAKTVGSLSRFDSPDRDYFPREYFLDTVMLDFGDESFCCPAKFHEILTMQYGDYMTPPKDHEELRSFSYYVK